MNKAKVIFLHYKAFEPFEITKYGIDILERYFDMELWTLEKIFDQDDDLPNIDGHKMLKVKSYKELVSLFLKNRDIDFVIGQLPMVHEKTYYCELIMGILRVDYSMECTQPVIAYDSCRHSIINKGIYKLFPPKMIFMATHKDDFLLACLHTCKLIYIHSLDYDIYLKARNSQERIIQEKYIVYVGEDMINHRDYNTHGMRKPFYKEDGYYNAVNRFFDFMERMCGYKVVIAEHPRCRKPDGRKYGGREVFVGKTGELIRCAELVITHPSLSFDFIALYNKLYILITLENMKISYGQNCGQMRLAKYLNINLLNIDEEYDEDKIKKHIYDSQNSNIKKYLNEYVKLDGTEDNLFFEIVARNVREYLGSKRKKL